MAYRFDVEQFFPRRVLDAITEVRVERPDIVGVSASRRKRRMRPTRDGKLNMLACDHPARGVTATLDQPLLMGNRQEYLGRVVRALLCPELDGVMAHTDLIEDLLILDYLLQESGGSALLNDRLVAGCMNRGGVHQVAGEIHDRFSSFTADSLVQLRLDGGKMLLRVDNEDERTLQTLGECAEAISGLSRHNLLAFVEPLPVKREGRGYVTNYSVAELVKWVGVCAGLGQTSRHTWLKIPYISGFEQVALATTLPILLLGGPAHGDPLPTLKECASGISCGKNVRGTMVGRNVLFPGDEDPLGMTEAVAAVIRHGSSPEGAVRAMDEARNTLINAVTRYL
jgi:hypothetical protein